MDGPETIFLQPSCCRDPNGDREWSEADVWGDDCPDHSPAIEYVRADRAAWNTRAAVDSAVVEVLREASTVLRNGYADAVAGLEYVKLHYGKHGGVGFDRVSDHFEKWVKIPEREGLLAGSHSLPATIDAITGGSHE